MEDKTEDFRFDLDQNMMNELSEKFDPKKFIKDLKISRHEDIEQVKPTFEKYGTDLILKSIEMGEEKIDRTYEILKKAEEKTGELKFPLFPQRYIEIAYLSIQPFKRLWINTNSPELFSYKINKCSIYNTIKEEHGEDVSNKMVCKATCFAIIREAFKFFDLDFDCSLENTMAKSGSCLFMIKNKQ